MFGVKYAAIAAVTALVALGAAAPFMDLPVKSLAKAPDVLSILHKRSPEERQSGVLAKKGARESQMLPSAVTPATPAPSVKALAPVPSPAPAAAVPVVVPPLAAPLGVVPAVAPAVPATIVPAAAGSGLFIPPLIIPGGGGGVTTLVVPPGGGAPPPPVPAVPEPETWAMMIIGFGLLGVFLRRRRVSSTEGMGKFALAGARQQA